MEIKNSSRTEDVQLTQYSSVAPSSSRLIAPTRKDPMVGFDDDLMAIKARLCGESSKLEVIPILGMGGIGNTILAKNAYDDPLTVEYFDVRTWVTVSQDYSTQEILSGLLVSMKAKRYDRSIESIVQGVYQHLKGRRYLIVMEAMWSTKAWDDVKMIFPDDYNGSRIILTTRLYDVAAYPDSCSPLHQMHFMDAGQSWDLLQQKVFPQESCPPELESIGKEIARSCRGLPLAVVLIAGLLSSVSKTQASWANIAENVNLAISNTNDEKITKILLLSYIHLPYYLRWCSLYMGGFPEDYEIPVSKLLKLWVAEGFIKLSGSKSFEERAEEYLEDLVRRSLVLVMKRKSDGKIKSCSIHDLLRDLCIRKAEEEKFILNFMGRYVGKIVPKSTKNQQRIIIGHSDMDCLENIDGSTFCTIICFPKQASSLGCFGNFRLLRVLDAMLHSSWLPYRIPMLPAEVFELFHLRYLAFTCGVEFVVPPSILDLQNLQTLIIQPTKILWSELPLTRVCLPVEIWRIPQLIHLLFIVPLPNIPEGAATFALENLQTLSKVDNFRCTEEILKMIPNLKKLVLRYSGNDYVQDQDYHVNLVCLHQLVKLKLKAHYTFEGKVNPILLPTTLKKLTLSGEIFHWKDMEIVGSLPNLQVLKLRNRACEGNKWETREGEFCQLKFLLIDDSELQEWITESSHFPSLKCLLVYRCWDLSEIPNDIGEIPTLELIEVDQWMKSLVESAKRIAEEQQSWGNDVLQVRVGYYMEKGIALSN